MAAVLATVWVTVAAVTKPTPLNPVHYETATLAGGCFWSLQETLRQIPGVIKTTVGYTGGTTPNPTYGLVSAGKTGHTEAVEVRFDPAKLSYEELLKDFLTARSPTQASRVSASHRSTIFYHNEAQRQTAARIKENINASGIVNSPVAAVITPATDFYPAEEYHQDYYRKTAAVHACQLE